jgi:Xaa-Pro aminopeptidase
MNNSRTAERMAAHIDAPPLSERSESRNQEDAMGGEQALTVEGDSQDLEDRVNNRTLRPVSGTFKEFMTEGWDSQEPEQQALESSSFTPARLQALGKRFPRRASGHSCGQPEDPQQRL